MTWTNSNRFLPGSTIRADAVDEKFDGVAANLQTIDEQLSSKVFRFDASFAGDNVLRSFNANSFIMLDMAGNLAVYPKAAFDSEIALASTSSQQATLSASSALASENNARQSELNAAASAQLAQDAAGSSVAGVFVAGPWNAATGAFPSPPAEGSSIWIASTNGVSSTAAVKSGDLIVWDVVASNWVHFVGYARVAALEAIRASEDARIDAKVDTVAAIAAAGL